MHRKLFALARDNAGKGAGIRSEIDGDTATIYIYDVIDSYWGVSAADLANALQGITASTLVMRINSPGGDVFEARAMMALLSEFSGTVTAKIDGLAASAASFLMLAASTIEIAEGGFVMIHKGWTMMMGNADDLRSTADLLDKVDSSIVSNYAAKTGKSADDILAWMKAETWFDAAEAVENGFCNSVMPTTAAKADAKAKASTFNLSVYDKAPKALTEQQPPEDDQDLEALRVANLARLGLYERTAA
ncbi:head maturation protease, ClpP-related [Sphingomonas abietis]|uniref:Clp protease ClpP n=1 Tax=Sphingomonas abietis TaxID=3012344 RepID=A0ABY7NVK1_9SPHN|nr:head maturation protease, ClpP-related [Sphingomonas abietis]WBO23939.1 Clp protease ClpP [Sphingomonas abietis]